jgi:hypothetical protein
MKCRCAGRTNGLPVIAMERAVWKSLFIAPRLWRWRAALEKPEVPLRVGSGSSSRALERSLCGIKLTFTWQSSVGPQQPISVAVPQRAISVAVLNRKPCRFRSGILCRLAARRRQMAIGRLYTEGMIGTLLRLLTIEATLPYCGYIDPLFVELRYDRHDHLQPRVQPGRQPGQARGRGRAGVRHRPWPSRLCAAAVRGLSAPGWSPKEAS